MDLKVQHEGAAVDADTEALLPRYSEARKNPSRTTTTLHYIVHSVSLMLICSLLLQLWQFSSRAATECKLKHSTWSPALDVLDDTYQTRPFEATFALWTPYKGPPTPEVNEAWRLITDTQTINISAETMTKMDKSLLSVQWPEEMGGGYMAELESMHQIHCLHMIWRDHHLDYFSEPLAHKQKYPDFYEQHFEHCVDMLRQKLMCTPDTGIVTFRWVDEGVRGPVPDFNTQHRCQDWDKVIAWNKENEAFVPDDHVWVGPPKGDPAWLAHEP